VPNYILTKELEANLQIEFTFSRKPKHRSRGAVTPMERYLS